MSTLSSVIIEGLSTAMPSPSIPGRLYFTTDTQQMFYDTGTAWDNVTPTALAPSGAANLVYATPNGSSGSASLRAIVAADVPILNQNTTGNAASVGGITVTGTPTTGQVITATSGTAADWQTPSASSVPISLGFILNDGIVGTNVGPMVPAARASTLTRVVAVTKASDGTTPFQFDIKQNGTSIFTGTLPTVSAGTSSGTVSVFTALTTNPLPVAQDDVFSIDVIQGTSSWIIAVQAET